MVYVDRKINTKEGVLVVIFSVLVIIQFGEHGLHLWKGDKYSAADDC